MIMQRISNNSSNEKIFHEEATPYKKALADSGYSLEPSQFEYTKTPANIKTKRNRRRKIMYFNYGCQQKQIIFVFLFFKIFCFFAKNGDQKQKTKK